MRFAWTLLALVALTGCSEAPKVATEEKKEPPKALEPLTGRQAYQQMYISARSWAPDCQPLQLKSIQLKEVKAPAGQAGAERPAPVRVVPFERAFDLHHSRRLILQSRPRRRSGGEGW